MEAKEIIKLIFNLYTHHPVRYFPFVPPGVVRCCPAVHLRQALVAAMRNKTIIYEGELWKGKYSLASFVIPLSCVAVEAKGPAKWRKSTASMPFCSQDEKICKIYCVERRQNVSCPLFLLLTVTRGLGWECVSLLGHIKGCLSLVLKSREAGMSWNNE